MAYQLPGKKTEAILKGSLTNVANGHHYQKKIIESKAKGFTRPAQIMIERASGDFLWDVDGNQYIDFQNGWATNPLGNTHQEIIDVVHKSHQTIGFHWEHPYRGELASRIAALTPQQALPRINFEVSGTEAAESAAYLALTYKQRSHIITFSGSFHGSALGTKLISGFSGDSKRYLAGLMGTFITAPYPFSSDIPAEMDEDQYVEYCLWYLEHHIPGSVAPQDAIAAIMIEPGLAEGGNWIPSRKFIQGIRKLCDRMDWLMIVDEVLTGIGRTGKMWGIEHYDVIPDIMVMGKNLSGGIEALACIASKDEIMGSCPNHESGSTFAGTPAGCAAALKTLEIIERDKLVENAARLAVIANARLAEFEQYSIVKQSRGLGLLLGIEFHDPTGKHEHYMVAREVRSQMLKNGCWAICDHETTVRMYPALNMDDKVLLEGLDILERAIQTVESMGITEGDFPAYPTGVTGF